MLDENIKSKVQEAILSLLPEGEETPSDFMYEEYINSLSGEPEGGCVTFSYQGKQHKVNFDQIGELDGEIVTSVSAPTQTEEVVEDALPEQEMIDSEKSVEDTTSDGDVMMNEEKAMTEESVMKMIEDKMSEMKSYFETKMSEMSMNKAVETIEPVQTDTAGMGDDNGASSDSELDDQADQGEDEKDTEADESGEEKEKSYTIRNKFGYSDDEMKRYFPSRF